jgi:hypothetical protein
MSPAQIFANPSLMMLVCLIGGALREGVERDLLVKLMVIGTFVPALGMAITGSMIVEEALGSDAPWHHQDDPVDEDGHPCSGWIRQDDHGWVWRSVSPVLTMIIALESALGPRRRVRRRPRRGRRAGWSVRAIPSQKRFLPLDLAAPPNCVLFVPVS